MQGDPGLRMVPNAVAVCGLLLTVATIDLRVRTVEEPYPRRLHGEDYDRSAAEVGRFLAALGRRQSGVETSL